MNSGALGFLSAALLAMPPMVADAALLTESPVGGALITFTSSGFNANPGPVVIDGITVTGAPEVIFGDVSYGFGDNGAWGDDAPFSWVAVSGFGNGSITFDLGGTYSSAGFFLNYSAGCDEGSECSDPIISAIGADGVTVLESFNLAIEGSITTPDGVNAGAFRGIFQDAANIRFMRLSGAFIAAHSLTVQRETVPEPGTLALLGLGLAGLSLSRRRKAA